MRIKQILKPVKGVFNTVFNEGGLGFIIKYMRCELGQGGRVISQMEPQSINIVLPGCPLNCVMCYERKRLALEKSRGNCYNNPFSAEQWKAVFEKYKKMGVSSVVITGGEPLLPLNRPVIDAAIKVFGSGVIVITSGVIEK